VIPRAIADLAQLKDEDLYGELATGMRLSVANALRLWHDAVLLSRNRRPQAFQIIRFLVEEEAAKLLILLDAARCPRNPPERFARHLKAFSDHLARGLYTEYYEWVIMPLREAREHIDRERQALYLDGPSDVDWIFRNDIERRREEALYVDYVAIRDAFHDEHQWHAPNHDLLLGYLPAWMPSILRIARALDRAGVTRPEAVHIVAELWRGIDPEQLNRHELREHNIATLHRLDAAGLLRRAPQAVYDAVANDWRAPLYTLDLRKLEVRAGDLREAQEHWVPPDVY